MELNDKVSVTIDNKDYLATIILYDDINDLYGVSIEGIGEVQRLQASELTPID